MNVALTRAKNALFIIGNAITVIIILNFSYQRVIYGDNYFWT